MPDTLEETAANLVDRLANCLANAAPDSAAITPRPTGPAHAPTAGGLPVLRWLSILTAQAPAAAQPVVRALADFAPRLSWRQTYSLDETGPEFLENYGWTELVGANGLFRDGSVSTGFLILGPNTLYPSHHHPALEHYVPLSGEAEWFDTDRGWRREPPLSLIVHRSGVSHAMSTGAAPLLAYFHWSGEGVAASARLT